MNINLTKKQEEYIVDLVESDEYDNKSEVIRVALRLHQIYRDKGIADLRVEIEKGINSGISKRSVGDILVTKNKSKK
ncbi:MAG: type II toxin-antitoxin system ParD family antitoxin [Flavobacteriaceae bacterium]|nr:type II toxin-antitoxin system ParD family antitoxin [Flavobacteriaceae bacterium]